MDDRLEKFIKSHRAEMDDKNPRKDLWADIEGQIAQETKNRRLIEPVVLWRAAAVVLLLLSSLLVFDKINQPVETVAEVEITNPQLLEAENYYVSLISQKREEILVMSEKYELGKDFIYEIDRLDSMYSILKKDIAQGNEENLVDAMILNLQLRIEVLNQQLNIIQSIENSQEDETIIL